MNIGWSGFANSLRFLVKSMKRALLSLELEYRLTSESLSTSETVAVA